MFRTSITQFITAAITVLMTGLFVTALILAVRAWTNFEVAMRTARVTQIDQALFEAQVSVRAQVPIDSTALIEQDVSVPVIQRTYDEAARNVDVAVAGLQRSGVENEAILEDRIRTSQRALAEAQQQVLAQANLPRRERQLPALDLWRARVHELIDALSQASVAVSNGVRIGDAQIAELVQVRRVAWTIRDRYGLQCSVLRLNVETNAPLTTMVRDRWIGDRAVYEAAWQTLDELLSRSDTSPALLDRAVAARRQTKVAQSQVDDIVEALNSAHAPTVSGSRWTLMCDAPFNSVLAIAREAQRETTLRAESLRDSSVRILFVAAIDLTAVATLGVVALIFVRRRFARPMMLLTSTIARLSRQEYDEPVPSTGSRDELGSLAQALEALRTSSLESERLQRAMNRFTADASHQMRTPLTILQTHLSVLEAGDLSTAEARASLADIRDATDRLQRLLTQLLKLARAEGVQAEDTDDLDLREMIQDAANEHVQRALAAGIELHFEADPGDYPTRISRIVIHEIVTNLIDNAIRYNQSGGHVAVRLLRDSDGTVRIEVEDDGPGIPAAEHRRVLGRFYRLKRDHRHAGSGLGLAIVDSLVASLGARLSMDNGSGGRGLLVRVDLGILPRAGGPAGAPEC